MKDIPKPKSRKELYLEKYEASKRGGKPFFPDAISHDALVALIVVAIIFILAILLPVTSTSPANPTGTAYVPRPEWYFIFLQEWLRFFPGLFEPVGAILLPLVAIIILFVLPFVDRNLNRTFKKRKGLVTIGVVVVVAGLALEITGVLFPPSIAVPSVASPTPSATFQQVADLGQTAYANSCASCHGTNGEGVVAPALWGPQADLKASGNGKSLLDYTIANMPIGAANSLSHGEYLDIVGYILLQNNDVSANATFAENQLVNIILK
jgi:mono/diheme cytochrome c family protein